MFSLSSRGIVFIDYSWNTGITDFKLSQWLIIDVNFVLKVHAASACRIDPEAVGSMFLEYVDNIIQIHML